MPTFSHPDMIPALKSLWLLSFPEDTEEILEDFFTLLYSPETCLVHLEEGRPVSMLFTLPVTYHTQGETRAVQYIYAACTHPEYRGKGIFGSLLQEALRKGAEKGMVASFLRPGEKGLISYYARFGYRPFFVSRIEEYTREELARISSLSLEAGDSEDYFKSRKAWLGCGRDWVEWDRQQLTYALYTARRSGGDFFLGSDGCVLCEPVGDVLEVRELLCRPEQKEAFLATLFQRYSCSRCRVVQPVSPKGRKDFYGLWCPLSPEGEELLARAENPYMGLSLE